MLLRKGTQFKAGYLLGRLCVNGFYRGFYATPEILFKPGPEARTRAEQACTWGEIIIDRRMIMGNPTILEYYDGTLGVQIPMLDYIATDLVTCVDCKPLPALENQLVKFLHGFLAGYAEALSEIHPKRRVENPDWSPVLVRLLQKTSKSKTTLKERT